jgi:hypothetical protein
MAWEPIAEAELLEQINAAWRTMQQHRDLPENVRAIDFYRL